MPRQTVKKGSFVFNSTEILFWTLTYELTFSFRSYFTDPAEGSARVHSPKDTTCSPGSVSDKNAVQSSASLKGKWLKAQGAQHHRPVLPSSCSFIEIALGGWFSGGHSCPAPFHLHRLSCPPLSSLVRVMGTEPQGLQETRLESRSKGTEYQCNPFQINT